MKKILIADDNQQITSILAEYAKKEGFEPIIALDGNDAYEKYQSESPDIALLDVMMPGMSGFEICMKIREKSNMPVIMVTARGEDYEKIMGLDIGADDYIVKPFSPAEVMARVRAVMRRLNQEDSKESTVFEYANLKVNMMDYSVFIGEESISLTKKEFEILWTLANNRNRVYSRDDLLNILWGYDYYGENRTVDSHMKRLRAKLDSVAHENWEIKTIWGVGYKFEGLNE